MAEINEAKLDKLVKAGKNQAECARELGVTPGQLGMLKYGESLVRTGKLKKAPATATSVKQLRDKENQRWEFIAARTGLSVAKVKDLYGDKESYIGRGPKPGTMRGSSSKNKSASKSKTKSASKKTGVRHVASGGKNKSKSATARPGRARTRAERAARSSNPS